MRIPILLVVAAVPAALLAQTQSTTADSKGRDLKYERDVAVTNSPVAPSIPRGYALVIGVSKYRNLPPESQLDYAERDADLIYSVLISPEGGNFKAQNVHRLLGPDATLANVQRELEQWLPSVAKPDDRVLIYFAGHGFVNAGKGYLAPYDLDPTDISHSGYSMDQLGAIVGAKIHAKWKVLLTDSCHSGAITPEKDREMLNSNLRTLQPSMFSLTASRDREQSFESKDYLGGHGLFTYFVYRGLSGAADESGDGLVTADELANYVYREVRTASKGKQNPNFNGGSFDNNMPLAFVPSNAKPAEPAQAKTGTLVFESNTDAELYLDGQLAGKVEKGKSFRVPGLAPGMHNIKAVKMGYEPDGPRDEMVTPGVESTVTIRITVLRRRSKAAVDEFDKGVEEYNKGTQDHYKKALDHFEKALEADSKYSQAAMYAGLTENLLFEQEKAKAYFKRAVEIDPDNSQARQYYGGMLLDLGDVDEAVRQLNVVVQQDQTNSIAWALYAKTQLNKEMFADAIHSAHQAIEYKPSYAEPHLWLAEGLKLSGKYGQALPEYKRYLELSDFDSKIGGKLNYYVLGYLIGMGKKKRANLKDVWGDLRADAYMGMCECERKLDHPERAIPDCQQALTFDKGDPLKHEALAFAYIRQSELTSSVEPLPAARDHLLQVLQLAPEIDNKDKLQRYIQKIDAYLHEANAQASVQPVKQPIKR